MFGEVPSLVVHTPLRVFRSIKNVHLIESARSLKMAKCIPKVHTSDLRYVASEIKFQLKLKTSTENDQNSIQYQRDVSLTH